VTDAGRLWGIGVGAALVALAAAVLMRPPQTDLAVAASTPADGATLATAPSEVELTFTAPVRECHVSARDAAGTMVSLGEPRFDGGNLVRQPVLITAPGEVTVFYHARFEDGGELAGTMRFGVGTAAGTAGGTGPSPPDLDAHRHDVDPLSAVLLVLDGAVAAGAVVLLVLRRPRRA